MAGVSDNENKEIVKSWIDDLGPSTVLDVGAGMGIYSILAKRPGQHWTALEVFAPYVNMFNLRSRYDQIIVADARYVNYARLGRFDLSIAADMLEHMPKADAVTLIADLLACSGAALFCFPIIHHDQAAGFEGNDFESHIDHWSVAEMDALLADRQIIKSITGDVLAYYLVQGDA